MADVTTFEYMENEGANLFLDATSDDDGISISITQWAESLGVTLSKDKAREFGLWLLAASGGEGRINGK